ncbi:MAG: acyltransferase family protein [Bryobacteraceae bacterium]
MSKQTTIQQHQSTAKLSGKRLNSLDGLRGVAVLSVIAFHTLRVTGNEGLVGRAISRLQETAWAGVDLFFVLSGFLITGILLDSRDSPNYFRTFFARRTLRIFPLYYGVLALAIIVVPAIVGYGHLPDLYPRLVANQFWLWTYTANYLQATGRHTLPGFGHFWSLAIEEQFYWFWPAVVYFVSGRRLFQICVAVCLLSPVLRLFLIEFGGVREWAIRQYTFTRLDTLLAGALVAVLLREPKLLAQFRRMIIAAVGLSSVVLVVIAVRNHYLPYEATETVVLGYSCLAILFGAVVHHLAARQGPLTQVLSSSLVRWFGRYSYGIYIFHWPIAQAYGAALEPKLAKAFGSQFYPAEFAFVVVASVSAAVAFLSWHVFEVRFLRLKEYFTYSTPERSQKPSMVQDVPLPELTGVNS